MTIASQHSADRWRFITLGTTSIVETHGVAPEVLETYRALEAAAGITVRSHLMISPPWRSAAGHENLSDALRKHEVRRLYDAVVWGHLSEDEVTLIMDAGLEEALLAVSPQGTTQTLRLHM